MCCNPPRRARHAYDTGRHVEQHPGYEKRPKPPQLAIRLEERIVNTCMQVMKARGNILATRPPLPCRWCWTCPRPWLRQCAHVPSGLLASTPHHAAPVWQRMWLHGFRATAPHASAAAHSASMVHRAWRRGSSPGCQGACITAVVSTGAATRLGSWSKHARWPCVGGGWAADTQVCVQQPRAGRWAVVRVWQRRQRVIVSRCFARRRPGG